MQIFFQYAANINTLGEVPDSSWFENRIGKRTMTIEELVKGPDVQGPPDPSGPWTVTRGKTEGITPGFTIKDAAGRTYFMKFDPIKFPQLATSAEVIATKFFYAFGYNVPENYLVTVDPQNLQIADDAKFTDEFGHKRKMVRKDLDGILKRVARRKDGQIQAIASLRIPGAPVGHFKYYGTRSDDGNDIFRHEERRELRGLRIFSAWLNHDDTRYMNSLDVFVPVEDKGYVKHYLLDFGSTLGSGSIHPQHERPGNEYIIEMKPILKAQFTLGLRDRKWRKFRYADYPSIGRIEAEMFRPHLWRPEYPNPAFDRMMDDDAFWATRIISEFSDEMIAAIVKTGQYEDPVAEQYLIETLIARRNKIVRYYFRQVNPLSDFIVDGTNLSFTNLGVEHGVGEVEGYRYQWFEYDNATEQVKALKEGDTVSATSITIPHQNGKKFLMVRIESISSDNPEWKKPVEVYLRRASEAQVVGVEHHL
jgi:hypothetical protein